MYIESTDEGGNNNSGSNISRRDNSRFLRTKIIEEASVHEPITAYFTIKLLCYSSPLRSSPSSRLYSVVVSNPLPVLLSRKSLVVAGIISAPKEEVLLT